MVEEVAVDLNPDVLIWLREMSGYTIEEVANKLKIEKQKLELIEEGKKRPPLPLIKNLSTIYKVPVAAFYLPNPRETYRPKDCRFIPGRESKFTKKTLLIFRKVSGIRKVAKELIENLGENPAPYIERLTIDDKPEEAAMRYRRQLGLSEELQTNFKAASSFLKYLREGIENLNIFVFQYNMPVEDARGFTLIDDYPVVITINSGDYYTPRIFTLLHEFGHVLLGESVVDIPTIAAPATNSVEKWCNEFASSFLFPKDIAHRVFDENRSSLTDIKTLNMMSKKYNVSKHMLFYNMFKLGYISKKDYESNLKRFKPAIKKKQKGAVPSERRVSAELGEKYIELVVQNYENKQIPYSEALEAIPNAKTKTFKKLLNQVR